ncbi:uncharacterized protein [Asterias amurensis]|uniref:uncharacterized protein n=1 Tax=Asterias amurensis TaxID=7602 RepID=UPI003AB89C21
MPALYYVLSIVEIGLCATALTSGLVVASLAGRQTEAFAGDCVLGGNVIWTSHTVFELNANDPPRCIFIVGVQGLAACIAFINAMYRIFVLCCARLDLKIIRIILVPVYSIMSVLILAEAAILSHGLNNVCEGFRSLQVRTANYDCELFQQVDWHIYDGSGFYEDYSKAERAGWVSFLTWCALVGVGVLHCLAERPDSGIALPNNTK